MKVICVHCGKKYMANKVSIVVMGENLFAQEKAFFPCPSCHKINYITINR